MKKKILSLVLAISMLASLFVASPVSADGGMTISMPEITLNQSQGTETVEVPMVIENNPGVLGVQIKVKYGEGLTLTNVVRGDALTALSFTKPGSFSDNPIKIMWDGESGVDDSNGTIATLVFEVPMDKGGEYPIEIIESIIINENMDDVETTFVNGIISVNSWHEHSFGDWEKYDDDQHKKQCNGCGYEEMEFHTWDDGTITVAPTHISAGVKTYTCTECEATFTETVTSPPHQFENWTMTSDEWHEGSCKCGETIIEPHTWDAGVVTKEPTAESDGIKTYTCTVCNGTKTEIIEKLKKLTFEVKDVTVEQGTRKVEVPISIKGNPGVLGVQLQVKYGEGLVLTDVKEGDALSSLAFTAPGNFEANPIKMMWDGQDYTDDTNGVIATLTFTVTTDEIKDYEIEITDAIVVDGDVNSVETTIKNGNVSVIPGEPEKGTTISVSEITVDAGEETELVEVPVSIEENKGVLGVQLRVKYAEGLTLKDVKAGEALKGLTCTVPGDFTANPIKIMWDGQDDADATNGVIAKLTFAVPGDKIADYKIEITDSIVVDKDINSVEAILQSGKISVVEGEPEPGPAITVSEITVGQGDGTETVEVPIVIEENTGVLGVQLRVKYAEGLTLTDVKAGDALSSLAFTAPGDFTANPIKIMWDGQDAADASNGVIAKLTFAVPGDKANDYTIEITDAIVVDEDVNSVAVIVKNGKISVHAHEYGDWEVDGDNHKKECSCGDVITEAHTWDSGVVTTPATCTQVGVKTYTCTACGNVKFEVLPMEQHSYGDWEADGDNHKKECSCGDVITEAHTWDNGVVTTPATCTEDGVKTYTCTVCNATRIETITPPGHADNDNDHNCDVCGTKLTECADNDNDHNCDVCGEKLTECADNDNDHNCDVCGTELTECADNDNDHNCDVCGTELTECADNDNDHNCDVCGTELTECADNDNDHNCDVCGEKLTECDWDEGVVTQEPTCTQNGVKTYTCACGDTYTEVIPAKGHTYGDWVADGDVHKKECSCGDVVTEAHAWNAGVVTKEPTETQTGIKTYTCTVCNEQKTEIIPVIKPDEPVVTGTTITVSNVTVAQGTGVQEVQVPVVISQNTGILGMTLQVKYAEGLTLTKVTKGDALTTLAFTKPGNLSANPVNMVWDADLFDDDKSNGTIAILTFTVPKENVKDYAVEITTKGVFDDMLDPVNVTTVNGKISVSKTHVHEYSDWTADGDNHKKVCSCGDVITELHVWDKGVVTKEPAYPQKGEKTYTCTVCRAKKTEVMEWVYNPGDPTDDGEIDTRDIISIRRYIAGGYNVVINLAGADVDKDGMIDSRDIILVRRYLAGGYGVVLK